MVSPLLLWEWKSGDINTLMSTINDVADTLDIEIESIVSDTGYIPKDLLQMSHIGSAKSFIGRT